ncbi:hypothetical protein ScPMuIL_004571 [Solemya velum]
MKKTFVNLGFTVESHLDLTTEIMKKVFEKASKCDHSEVDCFVCVISSHGLEKEGYDQTERKKSHHHYIVTNDGEIKTSDVLTYFRDDQCPSLKGKPKLFFIQACRSGKGNIMDSGHDIQIKNDDSTVPRIDLTANRGDQNTPDIPVTTPEQVTEVNDGFQEVNEPVACFNDMLVMLAAPSGKIAFSRINAPERENPLLGGWLIRALSEVLVFETLNKEDPAESDREEQRDLLSLLVDATRNVAMTMTAKVQNTDVKSVPQIIHKLTHDVYFPFVSRVSEIIDTTDALPIQEEFEKLTISESSTSDKSDEYKMDHPRRGKALIISNREFNEELELKSLEVSCNADVEKLQTAFKNLDFEVDTRTDLSSREIEELLDEISKEDHSDADCFVCVIISHGEEDTVFATDKSIELKPLFDKFKGDRSKSLEGKPKLFFIQTCRGDEVDAGVQVNVADAYGENARIVPETVWDYKVPPDADFLFAYATVSGYKAYANWGGSWFICELMSALKEYASGAAGAPAKDLLTIMTKVKFEISQYNPQKQIPCTVSMLTKDVYFRPKSS